MESPILGPITKVPYDILTEIFVHCLPQRRLQHRQPDTDIAPMLLCHVCSTWRTVALATATLWSHLSFCLTVSGELSRIQNGNWIVPKSEYAFLLWWKNNQRSMAPSLCLDLAWENPWHPNGVIAEQVLDSEVKFDGEGMTFLFDYISSAKYLEMNWLFWSIIGLRIKRGEPIVYPVPHTLVVTNSNKPFHSFYQDQIELVPNQGPSSLRQLYLNGESGIRVRGLKIPTHWSSLTHLVLLVYEMSLDYWHSLIRAVPQLQSGCFQIKMLGNADETEPTPFTLAQLSTLSISVGVTQAHAELKFALALLLAALHLPALNNLSLCSEEKWYDHRAIDHVYAVLDAVPTITTLTLGPSFLTLQKDEEYLRTLPRIKDAEPIWRRTPRLAHLRLVAQGPWPGLRGYAEELRDAFVRNLFHPDSRWLDLNNPACPIRRVTIIDRLQPERPANDIVDYTWARIREYAGRLPDVRVVFDVVFETQKQAIAGAWNEWGPNLK